MQEKIPYLFDGEQRLRKLFFIISCGLQSRSGCNQGRLILFYFFTLSKAIDNAHSFLGYIFFNQNLFSLSVPFSIMCTSVTEGIMMNRRQFAVAKHHYPGCQLNTKRANTRMYLRGLANLCSSATYIDLLIPFRAAYNRVNTVKYFRCVVRHDHI